MKLLPRSVIHAFAVIFIVIINDKIGKSFFSLDCLILPGPWNTAAILYGRAVRRLQIYSKAHALPLENSVLISNMIKLYNIVL